MTALTAVAATQSITCHSREAMLRQQWLQVCKSGLSADCEFERIRISAVRRKSGLTGRTAAMLTLGQWPVWAVSPLAALSEADVLQGFYLRKAITQTTRKTR